MPMNTTVCLVCNRLVHTEDGICLSCRNKMKNGVIVIPVADGTCLRLPNTPPLYFSEQIIKSVFFGTPALKTMLDARFVRMELDTIAMTGLPLA